MLVDKAQAAHINTEDDINSMMDRLRASLCGDTKQPIPASINVLASSLTVCHIPQQQVFLVSTDGGNAHAVHLFPKESCTCPVSKRCCHIIASMRSIGLAVAERKVLTLSTLMKKSRYVICFVCK